MRRAASAAALALFCVGAAAPVRADTHAGATERAVSWLARQQLASGQFAAGQAADYVAEAAASLIAGGGPQPVVDAALAYVAEHGATRARERAGYAGRIVLGISAAGRDPRSFGGVDHVAILRSWYTPVTGSYDTGNLYANALAVLGIIAARDPLPDDAFRPFRIGECRGGGVGHDTGCANGAHTDTTALAICIFRASGMPASDPLVARARSALLANARANGGYGEYVEGTSINANSTGLALSAIAALDEDPSRPPWRRSAGDPRSALLALQTSRGGFRFSAATSGPDAYATTQAIPGLAGVAYPIPTRAKAGHRPQPAPASTAVASRDTGSRQASIGSPVPRSSDAAPAGSRATSSLSRAAPSATSSSKDPASRAVPIAVNVVALAGVSIGLALRMKRTGLA